MALPNEPLTRGEQYLNRIATDSGTIPDEPLTRIEQYLDYIAKNGGGGSGGEGGGGSGGGVFVVNITGDPPTNFAFDKTAAEVFAAKQTMPVVVTVSFNGVTAWGDLVLAVKQGTNYTFFAYFSSNDLSQFTAASDDSYPVLKA